jgi:hypothetical protein
MPSVPLLVIGSPSHGVLLSALLGSPAPHLLRHAPRPVLVLRARRARGDRLRAPPVEDPRMIRRAKSSTPSGASPAARPRCPR